MSSLRDKEHSSHQTTMFCAMWCCNFSVEREPFWFGIWTWLKNLQPGGPIQWPSSYPKHRLRNLGAFAVRGKKKRKRWWMMMRWTRQEVWRQPMRRLETSRNFCFSMLSNLIKVAFHMFSSWGIGPNGKSHGGPCGSCGGPRWRKPGAAAVVFLKIFHSFSTKRSFQPTG